MTRRTKLLILVVLSSPLIGLSLMSLFASQPQRIGVHDGRLSSCPASPNCVCSHEGQEDEHGIEPFSQRGSPDSAIARLASLVTSLPRTRIVSQRDDYLHAEFTSLIFRFVDDVEFLVDREQQVIQVRSASRVGYSDLGKNRQRVEQLRELWRLAGESN